MVAGGVNVAWTQQCWVDVGGAQVFDPPDPLVRDEGCAHLALVGWGLFLLFWFAGCVGVVVVCCVSVS